MSGRFHIVALTGGGIRGLHTARILEMLESRWGGPIARRFDLLCGTSVGGIVALGLALERPASVLRELLEKRGAHVFAKSWRRRLLPIFFARHDVGPLRAELRRVFGDARLGDLTHPVVIPAVDASAGVAVMFKTPHHEKLQVDLNRSLIDVALATAAAPTYFPIFRSPDSRLFVDGGLVANAPGLCGLHEAEVFFGQSAANVHILAIGTASVGRNVRSGNNGRALDLGWGRWRSRLFDLTISAQESLAHNLLMHRCGPRYVVVDSKIDTERARDVETLNGTSRATVETLLAAAAKTAQEFLGDPRSREFAEHRAVAKTFHIGAADAVPVGGQAA